MDKTVGILGGGQLGRMLTNAANLLNVHVVTLESGVGAPAKQVNAHPNHVDGKFNDESAIRELVSKVDVVTMEIEHVNTEALESVANDSAKEEVFRRREQEGRAGRVSIQPGWQTVRTIQDKFLQKEALTSRGVKGAKAKDIKEGDSAAAVSSWVEQHLGGFPVMLKARKNAYDGRGNFVIRSTDEVEAGLKALGGRDLYLEQWQNFTMELAVMVVKVAEEQSDDWETATLAFPVVETVHEDSICKLVYAPARGVNEETKTRAAQMARKAVAGFEGKGVCGVEMFLLESGRLQVLCEIIDGEMANPAVGELLVNEIAPRPHNSGLNPKTRLSQWLSVLIRCRSLYDRSLCSISIRGASESYSGSSTNSRGC